MNLREKKALVCGVLLVMMAFAVGHNILGWILLITGGLLVGWFGYPLEERLFRRLWKKRMEQ